MIETLYPNIIAPDDVVSLLGKTGEDTDRTEHLQWTMEHVLSDAMTGNHFGAMLAGLNRLAQEPPHLLRRDAETHISQHFAWVLDIIAHVLERLLQLPELSLDEYRTAASSLSLLSESDRFPFPE